MADQSPGSDAGRRDVLGPERPRWLFLVTGGLLYAGALLGMWIVLAGQPDAQDLVAGSAAAVLAVGVGYLLSQRGTMVPSVRAADLRTLAAVPWQVVVETGQVFALVARKASGRPAAPHCSPRSITRSRTRRWTHATPCTRRSARSSRRRFDEGHCP